MIYKQFGKTDKKVSALGFGGMRFRTNDYKDGNFDKCAELLIRAQDCGVNYFDTAPLYCDDKSEEIFGHAFKQMKGEYFVTSKCNVGLIGENSSDALRRRLELSLKRLGRDKLNFYFVWCLYTYDQFLEHIKPGGIYDGMRMAKDEGLIDHICFSSHASGAEIRKMLSHQMFDGVLMGYNILNFKFREEGLSAAKEYGVGVVTMNPLGGGIIPSHPELLAPFAEHSGQSPTDTALRFNGSHDEITVVLSGMGSLAEVESNAKAFENIAPMTTERKGYVSSLMTEKLNTLCTGCGYCDICPVIPIPKYMDAYNQFLLTNDSEGLLYRLAMHWDLSAKGAAMCIRCGRCESLCTQKLPIMARLQEIAKAKT